MTLEFKTYRIEKVGKLIKDTKKRHIWKLMHGGKYYEIKAMESLMSGMFRIMVQNDKLFSAKVTDDHKRRGIELEYEGLNFRFKKVSESFDLYVNMNRFVPGATISGPTPPTNKINTMTRAEPTRQYNEDQKMQVVDKSISESYLVYNQDFDNSDEEDGFDNFGNKDKTTPRQNLTESRVRPGAKDTELNTITIQNKPTEVKGSMQFAFKKPGAPNVNTSSIGGQAPGNNSINLSANKEVKGSAKPFSKFGETPNPSDNDFLSFDALEAKPISAPVKPLQQRTNASALNFGWNAHGNTQGGHDAFGDPFDRRSPQGHDPFTMQQGNNNSGLKNSSFKSPVDKTLGFGFGAFDEGSANQRQNSNNKPQIQGQPNFVSSDPFSDFLQFNLQPAQNQNGFNNSGTPNTKTNNPFELGFELANTKSAGFNNSGFNQAPMAQVNRAPLETLSLDFNQRPAPGLSEPQQAYQQALFSNTQPDVRAQAFPQIQTNVGNFSNPNASSFKEDLSSQARYNFNNPAQHDSFSQFGNFGNPTQTPQQQPLRSFEGFVVPIHPPANPFSEPLVFTSPPKGSSNPFDFTNFDEAYQQFNNAPNNRNESKPPQHNAIDDLGNQLNEALSFNNPGVNPQTVANGFGQPINDLAGFDTQTELTGDNLVYPNPFEGATNDGLQPNTQVQNHANFGNFDFGSIGSPQDNHHELNF